MTTRVLPDPPWKAASSALRVLDLLNEAGEEARVVGGAVRNALLGLPVGEIDIATTAVPHEVIRRAKASHIKAVPTGIEHGTVTLILNGDAFEVTTLREDVETFGRKARVAFGRDWVRDAQRRDFSMNALSWSRDGVVHDHVGGLDDLAARRVRFIGDPDRRIAEDYLRILRFFRIHAAFGQGAPDRAGFDACVRGRGGLAQLSAERIRTELLKLLAADGAVAAVEAMGDGGLLTLLLGGVTYPAIMARMVQIESALGLAPDPIRRLGALGVAVEEDAARLSTRLRLSRVECKRLTEMADGWWRFAGFDDASSKRALYRYKEAGFRDRALLAFARAGGDEEQLREHATLPDRWAAPAFPLKAKDFVARGIAEGRALGQVLALAEESWLQAGFAKDQQTIDALADEAVAGFARAHRL